MHDDADNDRDRLHEIIGEVAPQDVLDKMQPDQVRDLMIEAREMQLPDSVTDRVFAALEARASEEGYESVAAYMEAHPNGLPLLTNPITISLSDAENDAVAAEQALQRAEPDLQHEEVLGFYNALVALYDKLNRRHDRHAEVDRDLMGGKPCVRGTRIPIDMILVMLTEQQADGSYYTIKDIVEKEWDYLTLEQVRDALEFASHCVRPRLMAEAMLALGLDDDDDDDNNKEA